MEDAKQSDKSIEGVILALVETLFDRLY